MKIDKYKLTEAEKAGILGYCMRPEIKKQGLHVIADKTADAQLAKVLKVQALQDKEVEG